MPRENNPYVSKKNDEPLTTRFWRENGDFSGENANMDELLKTSNKNIKKMRFSIKKDMPILKTKRNPNLNCKSQLKI